MKSRLELEAEEKGFADVEAYLAAKEPCNLATLDLLGYTTTLRGKQLDTAASLLSYNVDNDPSVLETNEMLTFRPLWFMFYGILRDKDILTGVTGVPGPHAFREARVEGVAVVHQQGVVPTADFREGGVVKGLVWKCPTPRALGALLELEGGYKLARVKILIDGGEVLEDGRMFVAGDRSDGDVLENDTIFVADDMW
ncbi:hypothetical protein TruAng_003348 [Truncatella angustata]|nr:hypothetical protein TruAng_003348 [Truncatella angustata]